MSMISAQCNELRETADELDERAKAYGPSVHDVISPMLRRAADTIWELRCKLADVVDQQGEIERLEAENERLRKLAEKSESRLNMTDATEMPRYDGMEYEELVVAAQYMWLENTKLRKKLEMLQDGYGSMSREHSQTIAELSDAHFEIDRLKAENVKLRELVRDMWHEGAFEAGACYEKAAERLEEKTRELGIKVGK